METRRHNGYGVDVTGTRANIDEMFRDLNDFSLIMGLVRDAAENGEIAEAARRMRALAVIREVEATDTISIRAAAVLSGGGSL